MGLFPPPAGSSTPKPPEKPFKLHVDPINPFTEEELKEKKERKPKVNKERDLLIECKGLLNQLKDYKALSGQGRTTGKRIKELLQKIEDIL